MTERTARAMSPVRASSTAFVEPGLYSAATSCTMSRNSANRAPPSRPVIWPSSRLT